MLKDSTFSDAAVAAASRRFHWVTVDRDTTPDIARYFNVSAYPSLIAIGAEREKVYRWSGYQRPEPFLDQLAEARRRFALYRRGEPWDVPDPRPVAVLDEGTIRTWPAPSEKVPSALVVLGDDLWVAQTGTLYRLDLVGGALRDSLDLNALTGTSSVRGPATDGRFLYAMQYGWTAGLPTFVIDPVAGRVVREIVTEEMKVNRYYGAHALTWAEGLLWVLHTRKISAVDPATGDIVREIEPEETGFGGLTWNGEHLVVAGREALAWVDPVSGAIVRRLTANYPLRAVTWHEGTYYLMEQPVFGYNTSHERIRVWPERTLIYLVDMQ